MLYIGQCFLMNYRESEQVILFRYMYMVYKCKLHLEFAISSPFFTFVEHHNMRRKVFSIIRVLKGYARVVFNMLHCTKEGVSLAQACMYAYTYIQYIHVRLINDTIKALRIHDVDAQSTVKLTFMITCSFLCEERLNSFLYTAFI